MASSVIRHLSTGRPLRTCNQRPLNRSRWSVNLVVLSSSYPLLGQPPCYLCRSILLRPKIL